LHPILKLSLSRYDNFNKIFATMLDRKNRIQSTLSEACLARPGTH
jgi:hypothetical protein